LLVFTYQWYFLLFILLITFIHLARTTVSGWSVTFENPNPCALKGSSVEFSCSYNYSNGEIVSKTAWSKGQMKSGIWIRVALSDLPLYQNRSEYLGDQQHDCSLAIHDLQVEDTGHYYFWFDTNMYGRRSKTSLHLYVTELTGDNVTLECGVSCQLFTTVWFKDGRPVAKPGFQAQAEDAGNYLCAVEGNMTSSEFYRLHCFYADPPCNVSIEVSHPGRLAEGSSVNLTCSSAANPAAHSYIWYRRNISSSGSPLQVGVEHMLFLPSVEASDTGLYLCQAMNSLGGNNSTEVLLTVVRYPNTFCKWMSWCQSHCPPGFHPPPLLWALCPLVSICWFLITLKRLLKNTQMRLRLKC
uniref:Ig-like domain-containing protein n=1 Tax=Monopterus albus TaxID=43700 RepID=A0A3Q3IQM8_MONAL